MTITLKDVTKDNWVDIICLEITKEQEDFVALNSESIAASKFLIIILIEGFMLMMSLLASFNIIQTMKMVGQKKCLLIN